jgi:hypothetical protein
MIRVGNAVLRLVALSKLNDQQLRLDWSSVTTVQPYDKEKHQLVDDTCKPGAPCVVLLPALRSRDTVHARAAVLPQNYTLN